MTEDEAKTKWCPFARTLYGSSHGAGTSVSVGLAAFNRIVDEKHAPTALTLCLASECMAWRESNRVAGHGIAYWQELSMGMYGADLAKGEEHAAGEHARFVRENPIQGYCGLAGKQE